VINTTVNFLQQQIYSDSNFSSRLADVIFKDGRTKKRIAEVAGVHPSALSRWLAGSVPDRENLGRLARSLQVDVNFLLGDDSLRQECAVREEPAAYGDAAKIKLTVEDIARLLHYDLDAIVRSSGDEQRRHYLTLRDVHLPSLGKLLNLD
jgi:transcriptional regulator with XRE-family HTH domain